MLYEIYVMGRHMTTMRISKETLARLDGLGNRGESYEDVIIRLLNAVVGTEG